MDKETRDVLVALTESMITLAHTAYYGHEMAWGCYQLMVEQSKDPKVPARFRKALHGVGKLTAERDKQIELLQVLLQKLKTAQ